MRKIFAAVVVVTFLLCGCSNSVAPSSSVAQTDHSTSSQDAEPTAYAQVIDDYKELVKYRLSADYGAENCGVCIDYSADFSAAIEDSDGWSSMEIEMLGYPQSDKLSDFGYKLYDMNGDGEDELFWARKDGTILAVFTIYNGKLKLLDAFWNRYKGVITENGELYTMGSGGAADTVWEFSKLSNGELESVKVFGTESNDEKQCVDYYRLDNDKKVYITEQAFDSLLEEVPFENTEKWKSKPLIVLK